LNENTNVCIVAKRWSRIYVTPRAVFNELQEGASFKEMTMLLFFVTAVMLCAGLITLPISINTQRELIEQELVSYSNLSDAQYAQVIEKASKLDTRQILGLLMLPFSVYVLVGVWSFVGKHTGELIIGATLPYRRVIPIACYASLVLIPEALIKTGAVLTTGSLRPHFGPGVFLDYQTLSTPYGFYLSSIDVFGVWFVFVLGLGLSQTFGGSAKIIGCALGILWSIWMVARKVLEQLGTVYV